MSTNNHPAGKTRVLIIDDSALMRTMIRQVLSSDPQIDVVDTAGNGPVALAKVRDLRPDVVTLDVEMPGMDGIELLRRIMREHPLPVIMLSAHTQHGAQRTLDALEAGAIDYVPKPSGGEGATLRDVGGELIQKIHAARSANLGRLSRMASSAPVMPARLRAQPAVRALAPDAPSPVIAIGISCGGPATLVDIFPQFPADSPPIVITQHMPPGFTKSFADRLNRLSNLQVKEAENEDVLRPGTAFVAPGDAHLTVYGRPGRLRVRLDHREPTCGHRPSVDVMFRSLAKTSGALTVAAIMTGMGNDGAEALGTIVAAGGRTLAQDQESCIVFGMPKAAIELGHAQRVTPLDQIVSTLLELSNAAAAAAPVGAA